MKLAVNLNYEKVAKLNCWKSYGALCLMASYFSLQHHFEIVGNGNTVAKKSRTTKQQEQHQNNKNKNTNENICQPYN